MQPGQSLFIVGLALLLVGFLLMEGYLPATLATEEDEPVALASPAETFDLPAVAILGLLAAGGTLGGAVAWWQTGRAHREREKG